MQCPQCKTDLSPARVEDVDVSRCSSCHGTWFTEEGFREAKDHADANLHWLDFEIWEQHERFAVDSRKLPCPSCAQPLFTLRYDRTPVEIDYCHGCAGTWLDESEFGRIIAALEAELARMPASELLSATLQEAAEIVKGPESVASEWRDTKNILQLLKLRVLIENPVLSKMVLEFQRSTPFS